MTRLAGLRVWVTRPAHQAENLCMAIEAAGGHSLRQPLLAIEAPESPAQARGELAAVSEADDLIFTSANAVRGAWRLHPDFAPAGRLTAIGRATAAALEAASGRAAAVPEHGYTSEDLLAMPAFAAPAGRRVGVITGEGGRGRIQTVLAERGAAVSVAWVYRRHPVTLDRPRLQALLDESDAIVITSGEALSHLVAMTPEALAPTLHARQLAVPSTRVLQLALDLGFGTTPLLPESMDETAVVDALAQLRFAGSH